MPFDRDDFTQKVEEFKEAGHEYRCPSSDKLRQIGSI